jgi:ribonucleotide monophosphatase NagD (HAD superfamily)
VVIGKPELEMAHYLTESAEVAPQAVLFVGDRLDTDILWAHRAGMRSALVYSGVTQPGDIKRMRAEGRNELLPEFIMDDLRGLPRLLDELLA